MYISRAQHPPGARVCCDCVRARESERACVCVCGSAMCVRGFDDFAFRSSVRRGEEERVRARVSDGECVHARARARKGACMRGA